MYCHCSLIYRMAEAHLFSIRVLIVDTVLHRRSACASVRSHIPARVCRRFDILKDATGAPCSGSPHAQFTPRRRAQSGRPPFTTVVNWHTRLLPQWRLHSCSCRRRRERRRSNSSQMRSWRRQQLGSSPMATAMASLRRQRGESCTVRLAPSGPARRGSSLEARALACGAVHMESD